MTLLEMRNITKEFGPVVANKNVNFSVEQGEVHALLGENGAGKSTLMNILFGMYEPTEGEIYYKGERVNIKSPKESIDLGIGMVHQHFMLIPAHTAIENVVLGYTGNKELLDLNAAAKRFTEMAKRYNMDIDPWEEVRNLSVGQQQRLEILKALYRDVDTLIMDEPTSGLDPVVRSDILDILYALIQDENKGVFFSTHITSDLDRIADYIVMIYNGEILFCTRKDELMENHAVVKGNLSLLDTVRSRNLVGIRKSSYGFDALSTDKGTAAAFAKEGAVIDKPTLEDIMLYYTRKEHSHA